jgi:hypothetical protein
VELAEAVPLEDVRDAGWDVSAWETSSEGATISLAHDFVGQDELSRLLADLAGASSVLGDARVTRSRSWLAAKDSVAVTADLRDLASGVQSDAALAENLAAAGVDVDALDDQLRSQLNEAFSLTLAVHAPDGETESVMLRSGDQVRVSATSSRTHTTRTLLAVVGVGLLVLAVVLTGASLAAMWRRRHRAAIGADPPAGRR